eukprot:TRINITY_DN8819_c0_g1_i2.p1 TRINITY_DN8819_c0_g1~~TRINITY_DN8819_c0_g1_i2.p1  ORF type:complete len:548 (+),score=115.54 TRINITY_DN8819_c0_g1_i2:221-1645(+)
MGDFILGSVGLQEMGDRHFVGYLDAFGKYNKFSLLGDKVCGTYRVMRTGFYNESVKAKTVGPGLLFYETEPPRHCTNPLCNVMAPNDNTFVNTISHAGKLLSLTDSMVMVEMDQQTLDVIGIKKWDDGVTALGVAASAHPVKNPATGEYIDFVGNENILTGHVDLAVYGLDDNHPKTRQVKTHHKMDSAPYMHSFGLTAEFVVLPRMPVKFNLPIGAQSMASALTDIEITEPGPDNAFHIVPLKGGNPIVVPLPVDEKLYYTHEANTFQNESGLVIDLATSTFNVFSSDLSTTSELNKAHRDGCYHDARPCLNTVKRFVLPLDGGSPTWEVISDPKTKTDFIRINSNYRGKKHCFYWGVQWFSDYSSKASMAIVKYNTCAGGNIAETKLEWKRRNWYPSEPTMVASPGSAEDDGLLVFSALDGSRGETWLITVNASTMETYSEAGPYPKIAFSTHGEFYPHEEHAKSLTATMYV